MRLRGNSAPTSQNVDAFYPGPQVPQQGNRFREAMQNPLTQEYGQRIAHGAGSVLVAAVTGAVESTGVVKQGKDGNRRISVWGATRAAARGAVNPAGLVRNAVREAGQAGYQEARNQGQQIATEAAYSAFGAVRSNFAQSQELSSSSAFGTPTQTYEQTAWPPATQTPDPNYYPFGAPTPYQPPTTDVFAPPTPAFQPTYTAPQQPRVEQSPVDPFGQGQVAYRPVQPAPGEPGYPFN
jgi:hypothetical protein